MQNTQHLNNHKNLVLIGNPYYKLYVELFFVPSNESLHQNQYVRDLLFPHYQRHLQDKGLFQRFFVQQVLVI